MSSLLTTLRIFTHRAVSYSTAFAAAVLFAVAPVAAEEQAACAVENVPPSAAVLVPPTPVFEFKSGARYAVTSSVMHVTDFALQPGESLRGAIAMGDTVRWVLAVDKKDSEHLHVLVKPTRPGLVTNLIIRTDRRTYLVELQSAAVDAPYMIAVGWSYPGGTPTTAAARSRD